MRLTNKTMSITLDDLFERPHTQCSKVVELSRLLKLTAAVNTPSVVCPAGTKSTARSPEDLVGLGTPESLGCDPPVITVWEGPELHGIFRVFLVGSNSYSVIKGGSDTINGVSERFRYVLPYLMVFLVRSRSYHKL